MFYLAAIPGFIVAAIIWFLPEPQKGQSDYQALEAETAASASKAIPTTSTLSELLAVPTLVVVYVVGTLISFTTGGLDYWLPSFVVRVHGFSEDRAGLLIGVIGVLTGVAGVLSGSFLADWLLRRTPGGRLLAVGISFVAGFPLVLAAIFVPCSAIAPTVVGWFSDWVGDLRLGLAAAPLAALLGGPVGVWGVRFVGRDEQVMLTRLRASREGRNTGGG